jgi:hypothetical protein
LEILGDGLDIYVGSLYGLTEEEPGFSLKNLITILLQGKTHWIFIYSHQYDGYQSVVHSGIEEVTNHLEGAIKRSEGIMLYH